MYASVVALGHGLGGSLPLIVTTVIVHVIGVMLIFKGFVDATGGAVVRRRVVLMFIVSMGSASPLAVLLHG